MPLLLDGTNGISGVDGTASNPSYEGTDSNTGIFYPAADTVAIGTGGTEALRVNSSQNVGINTTSPTARLHVAGTGLFAGGASNSLGVTSTSGSALLNLNTTGTGGRQFYVYASDNTNSVGGGKLSFEDASSGNRFVLDGATGNVGIGTTSPATKLDVNGSAQVTGSVSGYGGGELRLGLTSSGLDNAISTQATGAPLLFFDHRGTGNTGTWYWRNGTGAANERMQLTGDGILLVGKSSTADTVVGAMIRGTGYITSTWAATTNATTTYHVYSTGTSSYRFYVGLGGTVFAVSTTISAISDQRLKENIQDLDVGLNAVMALKPRKFDWKEGQGKNIKGDRGFIAQEFATVFPDLIDEWRDPAPEGEEPYKSVRQDLIPVLVKAIQEQQAMINEMKAEIAALKGAA